ncbi:MAG: calcium/sodium antiporter [Thiothrix sp.]|nr:calcium/sodium antiporter [Thiothrix sp.]HPQ94503.1 calcium/sodium antiporter [Thiolinea sp.]
MLLLLAVLGGLILLAWSSDKFVDGAVNLAGLTGIPPLVVGMVVIGFGTSAPELVVSASAALNGTPAMALGNAIGSNITNIALILGVTGLIAALPLESSIIRREIPVLLLVGAGSGLLLLDDYLSFLDGLLLMAALLVLLLWMLRMARQGNDPALQAETARQEVAMSMQHSLFWTVTGLLLLVVAARLVVWGASGIAAYFGVSDLVIGLTIVAIGTSLPELAASISSARRGETGMAVGNIIGSNLFNNLGVMGLAALIRPFAPPPEVISRDLPIMMGLTLLLLLFAFTPPRRNILTRWEASVLLLVFVAYQLLLYYQSQATA